MPKSLGAKELTGENSGAKKIELIDKLPITEIVSPIKSLANTNIGLTYTRR